MTFQQRNKLGTQAENALESILLAKGIPLHRFAQEQRELYISLDPSRLEAHLKNDASKTEVGAREVRYAPDFVVLKQPVVPFGGDFFFEVKAMVAPRYLARARRATCKGLPAAAVGDIERDALAVYQQDYGPASPIKRRTALFVVCSYNPKAILCEFVDRLEVLAVAEGTFNAEADGSGTPHSNINLDKMRSFEQFMLDEFSMELEGDADWERLRADMLKSMTYLTVPAKFHSNAADKAEVDSVAAELSKAVGRPLRVLWPASAIPAAPKAVAPAAGPAKRPELRTAGDSLHMAVDYGFNQVFRRYMPKSEVVWDRNSRVFVAPNTPLNHQRWEEFVKAAA